MSPVPLPLRLGVVAIGRPTFDLTWAQRQTDAAIELLRGAAEHVVGAATPVLDPAAVGQAIERIGAVDRVVVLQATFTDGRFVERAAAATDAELAIWAFPEHRGGGRLRGNSLCGMILGGFTVGELGRSMRWTYTDPFAGEAPALLAGWLAAPPPVPPAPSTVPDRAALDDGAVARAADVVERLASARLGVVGEPPPGFGPCRRDRFVTALTPHVDTVRIDRLIRRVEADVRPVEPPRIPGVGRLDRVGVEQSSRLSRQLGELAGERRWDAVAVRCWPEVFERLECAACASLTRLIEDGVPAACEADALGALSMLALGWLGDSSPFLADLVDIDPASDTAALWHCGVGAADLAADGSLRAASHPNRGVPLVQQLRLRPGPATVVRFSRSRGLFRLVLGRVEIVDAAMPYAGSGGVVRFERPVADVLETVVAEGLEHHLALVPGDVTAEMRAVAAELELPVVEL